MASIASSSDISSTPKSQVEAGPLPSKRGEIGYVEDPNRQVAEMRSSIDVALPARHPADRDVPTPTAVSTAPDPSPNPTPTTANGALAFSSTLASSTNSATKKRRMLYFLKPKKVPSYGGLLLTTIVAFICQMSFIGATVAGWVLAIKFLSREKAAGLGPSFVHVLFGVALIGQLLFIERRIFRLRAERYSYIHPGEVLPRHHGELHPTIAFSPWNRPSLPTYAAALAQSGVGTGDAEDHLIAAPPPPAYGNTRGSTLLLAGYLRDSLRAQRPVSVLSHVTLRDERPISYASRDAQWEEIQDAERARRLEDTLAQLERPGSHL